MMKLAEIRPGCLASAIRHARPIYRAHKPRYRLDIGNVSWIGASRANVAWYAHIYGGAPRPVADWFGRPFDGGAA